MPYIPPSSSGITFVFSQGGVESVYGAGLVPARFTVSAEGGAPVRGSLSETIVLSVAVTAVSPVNGYVAAQPEFSASATFAPVGYVGIFDPISVFAYKVPDVTGTAIFTPPFIITAARSAGALFNIPFVLNSDAAHGIVGEAIVSLRPWLSNDAASGRSSSASIIIPLSVAGYSSITVESRLSTAMPMRVTATGRTNVRGVAGITIPIMASASGDIRREGGASVIVPIVVSANNSAVRTGTSRTDCRFGVFTQGAVGPGCSAHLSPGFSIEARGSQPRGGRVAMGLSIRANAYGASGSSCAGEIKITPIISAYGEYRRFVGGSVSAAIPIRIYGQGSRPLKYPEPGIHIKTTTKSLAVFQ